MTYLEKLKQEYPRADIDELIREGCPDSYGYEKDSECRHCEGWNCAKCWNREMPGSEPKPEIDAADYINIYTEGHGKGYNEGLNDAWELAKKIFAIDDRSVVFDGHVFVEDILRAYTPQEALAKLKAYEDSKIEVGDVVEAYEKIFVVANITRTEDATTYFGIARDGMFMCSEDVKKTGKRIDIKKILEAIGE